MKIKLSRCRQAGLVVALGALAMSGLLGTVAHAAGRVEMKNPLYGDPAHPNLSGMWNPEFAYLGPPLGGTAGHPPGPPPGGTFHYTPPPIPQLTPPFAISSHPPCP